MKEFTKDYKDKMYLFKTKEFIDNKIFGLSENNMNILNNLGEYISLCNSDAQFINSPEIEEYYGKTKGNHSGLTQDEMIIPLIVINRKNNENSNSTRSSRISYHRWCSEIGQRQRIYDTGRD